MAGLAENVHGHVYKTVASFLGPPGARFIDQAPGRCGVKPLGITGLVYGGIRGVTRLAGGTAHAVLSGMVPLAGEKASSRQREAMLAALNGVLGDHLRDTANPLAIGMCLRPEGRPLVLDKAALAGRLPGASAKVLVHGLCMNDLQWHAQGAAAQDHGPRLARELGYTPVYLRYNSGLHISDNGRELAGLLAQLLQAGGRIQADVAAKWIGALLCAWALPLSAATALWPLDGFAGKSCLDK